MVTEICEKAFLFLIYRTFTPRLIDWYKEFKKGPKGNLLDIIFISSDHDEHEWKEYSAKMPWYALDFKDEEKKVISDLCLPTHLIV